MVKAVHLSVEKAKDINLSIAFKDMYQIIILYY